MTYQLPSLNALRAFEAAARHLSFKQAARELHVTPGAVGQQIRRLEADLAVKLFERRTRAVMLTEAGQGYLPVVRQAFQKISDATERLSPARKVRMLTVSMLSSFAAKWLVPRLGRFQERHPDIDVRITTSGRLVDFSREDVDVAIRHGLGRYPGLRSWRLLSEDMTPVCSPALLDGPRPLRRPDDLRHHTLLHDQARRDWTLWLQALGVNGVDSARGPSFSDDGLMLQAAIDGQGVALGRGALIERDMAEGRLVAPFDVRLPSDFAYYLVCPEAPADHPNIAAFRDWLLTEVGQDMDSEPAA